MADGNGDRDRGDAELDHGVKVLSLFDMVVLFLIFLFFMRPVGVVVVNKKSF